MSIAPVSALTAVERVVVGSIIGNGVRRPMLVRDILDLCKPEDMSDSRHRALVAAAGRILERGECVDIVTMLHEATAHGVVISMQDVADIAETCLAAEWDVLRHARTVASEAAKRRAAESLAGASKQLATVGVPAEVCLSALKDAANELEAGTKAAVRSWGEQLDGWLARIEDEGTTARPIPTSWQSLNRVLRGGLVPGELVVLAARPSVGKTAFGLNIALSTAWAGHPVAMASLEMTADELIARHAANVADVAYGSFRQATLTAADRQAIGKAMHDIRGLHMTLEDKPRQTTTDIRALCRQVQRKHGRVGLVVVDYLQLVTPVERSASREREVADMSREMKQLAKEFRCPVLLLAQLNREVERTNREPQMSDLRESGAIEQDADIVMFLHGKPNAGGTGLRPVKCIVAKGRASGTGSAHLVFDGSRQRFGEDAGATAWAEQHSNGGAMF